MHCPLFLISLLRLLRIKTERQLLIYVLKRERRADAH